MGSESGKNDWERDWVGAHAGKRIRDIAREPDVLPEERRVFDDVAERREDAAMRDFDATENKKGNPEKQSESRDRTQELVARTIEFIYISAVLSFFV